MEHGSDIGSADDMRRARRSLWRHRVRRLASGINTSAAVLLALSIAVMANYLASIRLLRWDISSKRYGRLSAQTVSTISSLKGEILIRVFFQTGHQMYEEVRRILREYEYAAERNPNLRLRVEFVDPDRDIARVRELKQKYDLKDPNVVVFEAEGRRKYVDDAALMEFDYSIQGQELKKKLVGLKTEQLFTSAIRSVSEERAPVVYFVKGHGERDIEDTAPGGYSDMARRLRRDNVDARSLSLATTREIPSDASALVVAGPERKFAEAEIQVLRRYLDRSGRLLAMIDPGTDSGLDRLLEAWGVRVSRQVAVGATLTGRELVVTSYGDHPVCRSMGQLVTMFYMPRVVEPVWGAGESAEQTDKPRVSVLVSNPAPGWAESDLSQSPPRFDKDADRPGPVGVSVAVEKGASSLLDVEIRPTRLVVVGDSYFVSNGALAAGAGGNEAFFMNAVNWLVERKTLLGIEPHRPLELTLGMDRGRLRTAFLVIVAICPGIVAVAGVAVWIRRRR